MKPLKDRINEVRTKHGLTLKEFGEIAGVGPSAVGNWEYGRSHPSIKHASVLAEHLKEPLRTFVDDDDLIALSGYMIDVRPSRATTLLVGNISAGTPLEAIAQEGEPVSIPDAVAAEYPVGFALRVSGDSMDCIFPPGIMVYVVHRDHLEVRDRDVVAVNVNGYDATVKRIFFAGDTVVLHPESHNPEHRDLVFDATTDHPGFRLIGKVVWAGYPEDVKF